MKRPRITKRDHALVESIVNAYLQERDLIEHIMLSIRESIVDSQDLKPLIHSVRSRMKEPDHLRDKLERKIRQAKESGNGFSITPVNILTKINDLGGIRILHLHTRQYKKIDKVLRQILKDRRYTVVEGPFARTWDDESRRFFESCGIATESSGETMYTSVHYVIESASRVNVTCEIQVRTLMEEVWGEIDHLINYPRPIQDVPCTEQLRVLARVTSSASRLVDSIVLSFDDYNKRRGAV